MTLVILAQLILMRKTINQLLPEYKHERLLFLAPFGDL